MPDASKVNDALQAGMTLGSMLRRMYRALSENVYGRLADTGFPDIRPMHSSVLRHLTADGARVTTLAAQAEITKQSMSAIVEDLIQHGYLESRPDPSDGRARLVTLTPHGQALQATLTRLSSEAEKVLAENIGEQKYAQLRALLMEWTQAENERERAGK
ncbi:MAG: MarR family winged helix-turn-helix transcriptional regulator [Pseudomonadota bacterium]